MWGIVPAATALAVAIDPTCSSMRSVADSSDARGMSFSTCFRAVLRSIQCSGSSMPEVPTLPPRSFLICSGVNTSRASAPVVSSAMA